MWSPKSYSQILLSKTKFLGRNGVEKMHSQHLLRVSNRLNRFKNINKFREINNVSGDNRNSKKNDLVIIEGCSEGGKNLRILIDSGSQANLISEKTVLALNKKVNKSDIRLVTAQGAEFTVCGQANLNLDIVG